jgi:predicted molibdopterin-dependent oxidoreductase YjgC
MTFPLGADLTLLRPTMGGRRSMSNERVADIWGARTAGRPVDCTGLSYALLHERGGVQWPCNPQAPDGTERLCTDGRFPTAHEDCETFGHDLATGATVTETEFRALRPDGRAILKTAPYEPAYETPDEQYPLRLTTGRTVYHWHTRTKTRRVPQLQDAASAMWVEISAPDAADLGIDNYGNASDDAGPASDAVSTAANELTITAWDPVSKQPEFKVAAVRVERVRAGDGPAPAPTITASAPVRPATPGTGS